VLTLGRFGNPHLAEEANQSAFIALAGKAGRLRRRTIIAGWLHRAVHFAALKLLRAETRRKRWEEQAAAMDLTGQDERAFQEYTLPHVDVALSELSDSERDAVVLRFLRRQSLREVAQSLGTSEEAAKKRVSRALEKLRALLARRGIVLPVAALAAGAGRWLTVVSPEEPEGAARAAGLRARPNLQEAPAKPASQPGRLPSPSRHGHRCMSGNRAVRRQAGGEANWFDLFRPRQPRRFQRDCTLTTIRSRPAPRVASPAGRG